VPYRFHPRLLPLLFALAALHAYGREVTVRIYTNQAPEQLTLVRGGNSTLVKAGGNPVLHVVGSWKVKIPGQDPVALAYPLDIHARAGGLVLTLRLPIEDYVAAVLAGESAGFRSEQSMAAMAVAARTYAVRFQGRHKAEGYDFCDTTHCQDLRITAVSERVRQAAEQTEGELLWFQGSPAATFYGKDCGGSIEAAAVVWPDMKAAYLGQRDDPYCAGKRWTSTIRKEELRLDSLRIVERTASGRALRLQAGGRTVPASSLRFGVGRALGWERLPSDLYEVNDGGDRWVFEGRGSGHGVGLCPVGAARMGEEGRSYRQILEFYYPGTKLGVAAQGFMWQALGGERVQVTTTRPQVDQGVVAMADRLARAVEERSGLRFEGTVRLKIYPTVAAFRDATGEPGWVAGSTRAGVIRLQPQGAIEGTIRHELLHVLVESRARAGLPLWFREGAVGYLTASQKSKVKSQKSKVIQPDDSAFLRDAAQAREAYDAALDCFTRLVDQFGEATVLGWISGGLPPAAMQALATK
jgi:stage II sporulation protein D